MRAHDGRRRQQQPRRRQKTACPCQPAAARAPARTSLGFVHAFRSVQESLLIRPHDVTFIKPQDFSGFEQPARSSRPCATENHSGHGLGRGAQLHSRIGAMESPIPIERASRPRCRKRMKISVARHGRAQAGITRNYTVERECDNSPKTAKLRARSCRKILAHQRRQPQFSGEWQSPSSNSVFLLSAKQLGLTTTLHFC